MSDHDSSIDNEDFGQEVDPNALSRALNGLTLLGDDIYLRMQANNVGLVDGFLNQLESELLQTYLDRERTPIDQAMFLSAQSQMWIFATYELMRTWRERADKVIKWADNKVLV